MSSSFVRSIEEFPEGYQDAYIGNGIIGYRVKPNPFVSWKSAASGYVLLREDGDYEGLAYAPYPFAMDFKLGQSPSMMEDAGSIRVISQSMDMSSGELATVMEAGNGIRLEVLQFVSRTCPVAACQEVRVSVPESGELVVTASAVSGPGNEIYAGMPPGNERVTDLMLGYTARGDISRCGVSVKVGFSEPGVVREEFEAGKAQASRVFRVGVERDTPLVIRTIAATVTSAYHPQPHVKSCRLVNWAESIGFDGLRAQNRQAWGEIWKSRVKVTGDPRAQDYLDCSLFYMFSSAHPSCRTSIPPFGVSQAMNYAGHVFWDTDTYMTPALLLTSPETAKMTVEYRIRRLDAAKQRAECYGYRGAMYPWESDTRGYESTPSGCATGWLEQHVNMCVALATWWYQQAAGDEEWAREVSWPILKSVAEWVESRVIRTERGYEIGNIMSADEEHALNNSSYVNALCAEAMRVACRCAEVVGVKPGEKWGEIAEKFYIPIGPAPEGSGIDGDIIYMHESGWEESACVDSFMVGFPFDLPFDRDLLRRTYDFFIKMDGPQACMGHCFFAGEAAFVGRRAEARRMFDRMIDETWEPAWGFGTEYTSASETCFVTTMGGMLQTAMMGFTGIRFERDKWTKYKACLPEGWEKIEIERIWLGGKAYRLEAVDGENAVLTEL